LKIDKIFGTWGVLYACLFKSGIPMKDDIFSISIRRWQVYYLAIMILASLELA